METNSNSQKEVVDLSHIYQMSLIWLWVGIGAVSSEFPQAHLTHSTEEGCLSRVGVWCQSLTSQQCYVGSVIQPKGTRRALNTEGRSWQKHLTGPHC